LPAVGVTSFAGMSWQRLKKGIDTESPAVAISYSTIEYVIQ